MYYGLDDVGWRNEVVHGKARDVENDVVDAPKFLHPGPGILHGELAAAEDGGNGAALMSDEHAVDVPVVPDAAAYGGLPVHRLALILRRGLYSRQMGVLQVYQQPTLLGEIPVQCVPNHLCWALASLHHRRTIC